MTSGVTCVYYSYMNPNADPNELDQEELYDLRVAETEKKIHDTLTQYSRKPVESLRVDEKAFIQARRSYLSEEQEKRWADVLTEKLPRPDGQVNEEEEKVIAEMTRKELERQAEIVGVDAEAVKKAKKNQDLIDLIEAKKEELKKADEGE